jgi:ABC-2 type transport system ATP-binding protein
MEEGELLGFIGPNGAGKSTTIKLLTGILHPTSGFADVLGFTPWSERRMLAYNIGTVFGQRPQLWYHLPAIDTFRLFGSIYELDETTVNTRVGLLAEAFDIEPLLETPVRKLSLGQRMRCEVAASLLHRPRLLLLDEPSIGLDVVAKRRIRDTIKEMHATEGIGMLLTSHDAGDLEALCKRVIIVNHGRIVYEDRVSSLKRRYLTTKQIDVRFADPVGREFGIEGTELLKIGKDRCGVKLRFDTRCTPVATVIARIAESGAVVDVTIRDPALEDVIGTIYSSIDDSDGCEDSAAAGSGAAVEAVEEA